MKEVSAFQLASVLTHSTFPVRMLNAQLRPQRWWSVAIIVRLLQPLQRVEYQPGASSACSHLAPLFTSSVTSYV